MYALSQLPAHTKCIGFALNTNKCQAEAGEWNLLLGLAHHLTSTGLLDPPCMLPKLPRGSGRGGGGQKPPNNNSDYSSNIKLLGAVAKQITTFLAPARRQREMKEKIQRSFLADSGGGSFSGVGGNRQQQQAAVRAANGSRELLAFPDNNNNNHNNQNNRNNYSIDDDARGGEGKTAAAAAAAAATLRWHSVERDLCESCWALRIGASAAGGSRCQRCGQTHRRGFSQDLPKRGGRVEEGVGPVPWQQFGQVRSSCLHACGKIVYSVESLARFGYPCTRQEKSWS